MRAVFDTSKRCTRCLDSAVWKDGELRCSECGQLIAIRYRIGEEVTIYTFQKFRANQKEIERREGSKSNPEVGGYLGDISLSEFADLVRDFRSDENNLFSLQGSEGRVSKDYESEDSSEFLQVDDLKENTY